MRGFHFKGRNPARLAALGAAFAAGGGFEHGGRGVMAVLAGRSEARVVTAVGAASALPVRNCA